MVVVGRGQGAAVRAEGEQVDGAAVAGLGAPSRHGRLGFRVHSRIVPSSEALARVRPSGLKTAVLTQLVCPVRGLQVFGRRGPDVPKPDGAVVAGRRQDPPAGRVDSPAGRPPRHELEHPPGRIVPESGVPVRQGGHQAGVER
ncbi:hypothetical protein SVIOM342S_03585 [Streptomyces violaceorubidus]